MIHTPKNCTSAPRGDRSTGGVGERAWATASSSSPARGGGSSGSGRIGSGTIRPVSLMPVVSRFGHWAIQVRVQRCVLCYDWSKCRALTTVGILPRNYMYD